RTLRGWDWGWRYVFNPRATLGYRLDRPRLEPAEDRVVENLRRDGIALTSVRELLGASTLYGELCAAVEDVQRTASAKIETARREADSPKSPAEKTFFLELLGSRPALEPESVFGRFALSAELRRVANAYFGMFTRLRQYNV